MSLLELIVRRSGSNPSSFSLPDALAEEALLRLKDPKAVLRQNESEQINRLAGAQLAVELLSDTPDNAIHYVEQLRENGIGERRLLGSVITGAADALGEAWDQDRLSFVQVTEAMGHLLDVSRAVMTPPPYGKRSNPNTTRVLLMRTPGEDHVLGLRLLAQEMRGHGWLVRLDLSGDLAAMAAACTHQTFDIIGFSAAGNRRIPAVTEGVRAARRMMPDAHLIVGGWLGANDPGMADRLGADLCLGRNRLPIETLINHFHLEAA